MTFALVHLDGVSVYAIDYPVDVVDASAPQSGVVATQRLGLAYTLVSAALNILLIGKPVQFFKRLSYDATAVHLLDTLAKRVHICRAVERVDRDIEWYALLTRHFFRKHNDCCGHIETEVVASFFKLLLEFFVHADAYGCLRYVITPFCYIIIRSIYNVNTL